jgi:hypothetical protein
MSSKIKIKNPGSKKSKNICDNYVPDFVKKYELEKTKVSAYSIHITEDCVFTKKSDYYQVTEWGNGEGYDLFVDKANGGSQSISLHHAEVGVFLKLLMEAGAITDGILLNDIDLDILLLKF